MDKNLKKGKEFGNEKNGNAIVALIFTALILVMLTIPPNITSEDVSVSQITTDKHEYSPEDTVEIKFSVTLPSQSGYGYSSEVTFSITAKNEDDILFCSLPMDAGTYNNYPCNGYYIDLTVTKEDYGYNQDEGNKTSYGYGYSQRDTYNYIIHRKISYDCEYNETLTIKVNASSGWQRDHSKKEIYIKLQDPKGIDTSEKVSNPSTLNCLKNKGISFIGRYYAVKNKNTWKAIITKEAQMISNECIYIVSIWEDEHPRCDSSNTTQYEICRKYFTYEQGKKDGYNAFKYAHNIGQPENTPVYFAVDFDAIGYNASDGKKDAKPNILDYFKGVKDGYKQYLQQYGTPYKIGVYSSYWVLSWLKEQGIATYFYQAYGRGLSGGDNKYPWHGYNIQQTSNNQYLCNIKIDDDKASGDFGGWKLKKQKL